MINLSSPRAVFWIQKTNSKIDTVKAKLNDYTIKRAQGVMLRTQLRWAELSEKNTKYFYNLEKSKSKTKTMSSCHKSDGSLIKNPQEILFEQSKFYERLYSRDSSVNFQLQNMSGPKLNITEQIIMNSEITAEEISCALKDMSNGKCPGADGLPVEFYKTFWNSLKPIFLSLTQQVFRDNRFHESGRIGVISLIPKKGRDRNYIQNWRPITLLNVDYKIISKVIAERIKIFLPNLINSDQTGFMSGRNISDNIRRTIDIVQHTINQSIPAVIVSIDFEKAFDRVDYNALYKMLSYFNFSQSFIQKIKVLFTDFQLFNINGGHMSSSFIPTRGLFQGNPVASYLFLILMEILAIEIRNKPNILGIHVNGYRYLLSQFADDMNIFLRFDQNSLGSVNGRL